MDKTSQPYHIKYNPKKSCNKAPLLYFGVTFLTIAMIGVNNHDFITFRTIESGVFWAVTLVTFVLYMRVSFQNPGYVEPMVNKFDEEKIESVAYQEYSNPTHEKERPLEKQKEKPKVKSVLSKGMSQRNRRQLSKGSMVLHQRSASTTQQQLSRPSELKKTLAADDELNFMTVESSKSRGHQRKASKIKTISPLAKPSATEMQSEEEAKRKLQFDQLQQRVALSKHTYDTHENQDTEHYKATDGDMKSDENMPPKFDEEIGQKEIQILDFDDQNQPLSSAKKSHVRHVSNLSDLEQFVNESTQAKTNQPTDQQPHTLQNTTNSNEYKSSQFSEQIHIVNSRDSRHPIEPILEEDSIKSQNDSVIIRNSNEVGDEIGCSSRVTDEEHSKQYEADDDMLFVDQKFCTVCQLEQPLRSKHCRQCKKCVSMYDHHCPWIGNCVAERTRVEFYWYLWGQFIELLIGLVIGFKSFATSPNKYLSYLLMTAITVDFVFLLMVTSLVVFHSYLAINNLTTWERLSWNKISYMKIWPKKYGSPFNKGVLNNLRAYCRKNTGQPVKWKMPSKLPSIEYLEEYKKASCFRKCLKTYCAM